MPFITQGKTNWKYILIIVILAVIVGGGILGWIKRQEVPPAEFPEIKKPEKGKIEVEYKTFTDKNFSVDYPALWKEIQDVHGVMGGAKIAYTGEPTDMCGEWVETYSGTAFKIYGLTMFEGEIESYINYWSSEITSRESETIENERGEKYIFTYDYISKEGVNKIKFWAVISNCGDNTYLVCLECAEREAEKDQKEIVNHIISSIRCKD